MILQLLFYDELETFVLKCKFNSKSLPPPPPPPPLIISGSATDHMHPDKIIDRNRHVKHLVF